MPNYSSDTTALKYDDSDVLAGDGVIDEYLEDYIDDSQSKASEVVVDGSKNGFIDIARIVSIAFVMLGHAPKFDNPCFIQQFVGNYLTGGSVPLFFAISGWFVYSRVGMEQFSSRRFLWKKCKTLILPFLVWNVMLLAAAFLVKYTPLGQKILTNWAYLAIEANVQSIFAAIVGYGRSPIVYQMWSLRDLILIIFAVTILLHFIPRKAHLATICIGILAIFYHAPIGFFCIGMLLNHRNWLLHGNYRPFNASLLYAVAWLGLCLILFKYHAELPSLVHGIGNGFFRLALACLLARFMISSPMTGVMAGAAFLLYAGHEPLQSLLGKLASMYLPASAVEPWMIFLGVPAFVFGLIVLLHHFIVKRVPWLGFLTGGR